MTRDLDRLEERQTAGPCGGGTRTSASVRMAVPPSRKLLRNKERLGDMSNWRSDSLPEPGCLRHRRVRRFRTVGATRKARSGKSVPAHSTKSRSALPGSRFILHRARVGRSPKSLIGHHHPLFFNKNRTRTSLYPIENMEDRWLALFWSESLYLIDLPRLRPVGSVLELVVLVIGRSHAVLGRRSEVSSIESQFLVRRLYLVGLDAAKR
jgi:hypothetical protein